MEDAAAVAQQAVRHDLGQVAGRQAAEHRAPQGDLPAVLEHAHLAPVLGLVRRGRLLECVRGGLVHGAPARLHHPVGKREVVPPARVDLDVVRAVERVDRAVAARDRAEPRLGLAQLHLVAPVDALPVRRRPRPRAAAARRRTRRRGRRGSRRAGAARPAPRSRSRRRRRRRRSYVSRTARFWAATLPPRSQSSSRTRGSRAATASTSSFVRSVDASDATTIASLSAG